MLVLLGMCSMVAPKVETQQHLRKTRHFIKHMNEMLCYLNCCCVFWRNNVVSSMRSTSGPEQQMHMMWRIVLLIYRSVCFQNVWRSMFSSAAGFFFFFARFPLYSYLYPSDSPCLRGREVHCCCLFAQEENSRIQRSSVSEGAAVKPRG